MKSLKTFNLDQDVIRIIKTKQNQSQFVCKAIRKLHSKEEQFDLGSIELRRLLVLVSNKLDFADPMRPLIVDRIDKMRK